MLVLVRIDTFIYLLFDVEEIGIVVAMHLIFVVVLSSWAVLQLARPSYDRLILHLFAFTSVTCMRSSTLPNGLRV